MATRSEHFLQSGQSFGKETFSPSADDLPGVSKRCAIWSLENPSAARRIILEGVRHALRLEEVGEEFAVEAFVPEASVEALVDAVLPETTGLDEEGVDPSLDEPLMQMAGNKLPTIVTAHMTRRPAVPDSNEPDSWQRLTLATKDKASQNSSNAAAGHCTYRR